MSDVKVGKDTYDCVVIVIDCPAGDLFAVPAKKKGLTAKEVADKMINNLLTFFVTPATICSGNAPQFTGGWLTAICAYMGVRHATSLAHPGRPNG